MAKAKNKKGEVSKSEIIKKPELLDDEPYLKTIAQLEKERDDIGSNPSLLPDVDKKSMRELTDRIAQEKKSMNEMAATCADIEFVAQTEEIKYKDGDTLLVFKILDTVIDPLNKQKYRLNEYRVIFDPIYK